MPTQWALRVAATTVALAAGVSGCQFLLPPPAGLVFITLDTTRADRLPAYGNSSVTTPALDRRGEKAQDYLANRESLAALGYVSGPPQISSIAGRDPKDAIDEYNAITRRRAMR